MLTEEYRPRKLSEVIGQENNIKVIKGFLKKGKLPHMLFYGPAGTGKTSTAICIAKEYYGDEWREYFIELNASDDRGINVVREKIKHDASIATLDYPFKIMLLDEVDAMTKDAQNALRRIIETYSKQTVFILSCNYKNKLIDPLFNRCVPFNFKPLSDKSIETYIKKIAHENNMTINPSAINLLCQVAQGSVRPVLTTFEKFLSINLTEITEKHVAEHTGTISHKIILSLIDILNNEQNIAPIDTFIDEHIIKKGVEPAEILQKLYEYIKTTQLLTKKEKLTAIKLLGDVDFRIAEGATPSIQLKTFFVYLLLKMRN